MTPELIETIQVCFVVTTLLVAAIFLILFYTKTQAGKYLRRIEKHENTIKLLEDEIERLHLYIQKQGYETDQSAEKADKENQ